MPVSLDVAVIIAIVAVLAIVAAAATVQQRKKGAGRCLPALPDAIVFRALPGVQLAGGDDGGEADARIADRRARADSAIRRTGADGPRGVRSAFGIAGSRTPPMGARRPHAPIVVAELAEPHPTAGACASTAATVASPEKAAHGGKRISAAGYCRERTGPPMAKNCASRAAPPTVDRRALASSSSGKRQRRRVSRVPAVPRPRDRTPLLALRAPRFCGPPRPRRPVFDLLSCVSRRAKHSLGRIDRRVADRRLLDRAGDQFLGQDRRAAVSQILCVQRRDSGDVRPRPVCGPSLETAHHQPGRAADFDSAGAARIS